MHVQHMHGKTSLSNQVKISKLKTHVPKKYLLEKVINCFIATVGRSNLSLFDRQKALGMIDDETNT